MSFDGAGDEAARTGCTVQLFVSVDQTGEVIAVVFEKGNPDDYKTFYKFGEIE